MTMTANPDSALRQVLWECPDCTFAFDASHSNADGTYSCPNCAEAALRQALVTAEKALREIGSGYYLAKDAPKRLDECVDLAREAHALITEALKNKL